MGDLETDFMENIFAPHHGRDSGKVPKDWLDDMNPKIIVIGEAPSMNLNYYDGFNTITQNSAGNITFDCTNGKVHIYTSKDSYSVNFLEDENMDKFENYIGTLNL